LKNFHDGNAHARILGVLETTLEAFSKFREASRLKRIRNGDEEWRERMGEKQE
jgi:hypothetical protein